ncbi:rhodanese-like domain-containing protein [Vibrio sp. ABG19]|uniref:rhodanese-like domain-containing protein n=1 Tax=Vibrio sp. ABG19 TaxID=2817385 RepID=UPI00249DD5F7|nr:rhodanese-like domain-containing protein [Vibrio sp. ABG19]WGY45757.1 rhodanese-like domain-containing protein [Vibrio sp. ABG19]
MFGVNWKAAGLAFVLALPLGQVLASERAEQAWRMIDNGALVIDVRTTQEYADGHLPEARNIPLSDVGTGFHDIDKQQPIVVYCRSGGRAAMAMEALQKQGFTHVHNGGGLNEMQETQMNTGPLN